MRNGSPPRLRLAVAWCAVVVVVVSLPAQASAAGIPDGDSATLISLLFESVKQTSDAGQILTAVQGSLATAESTLAVVRGVAETVNEFRYISENPNEIFDAAQAAFAKTFPEADGVRRETDALRTALAAGPNGELNPYALQQTLQNIGRTQENLYDTLITLDEGLYGLTEGHLQLLRREDDLGTQGEAVFRETMDPGCRTEVGADGKPGTVCGLDLKRAAVLGAKSQAISAASLRVVSAVLTEQLRLSKIEAIRQLDDGARMSATELDQARGLQSVADAVDETLDPTKDDAQPTVVVERPPSALTSEGRPAP